MKKTVTACSLKKQAGNPSFNQNKRIILFLCLMFFNLYSIAGFSEYLQPINPRPKLILSWNINVGCQVLDPPRKESDMAVEDIDTSTCIEVCEGSDVTYTLSGYNSSTLAINPNVQWTAAGGTASAVTNTDTASSIHVLWGTFGTGSVSFSFNTGAGIITKTLCITIIKKPTALFKVYPMELDRSMNTIYACIGQPLQFMDFSSTNGGTAIVTRYWDFRDGTFSVENNPTHTFTESGEYKVLFTVTNSCGCKATYTKTIVIKAAGGFEISCPSVVCEGQTSTYKLPFDEMEVCENYNFSVIGGTITDNPNNGSVTVTWDHVYASGFGFVTFTPESSCHLECLQPTTIKIPIIQTVGTIQGKASPCIGEQERYTLPQWPATDFHWEIVGNTDNALAFIINTDQRNEVIVQPMQAGVMTLRCVYQNTLLHCGGSATFIINVKEAEPVTGPTNLCISSTGNYHTVSNHEVNWTLTKNNVVVSTLADSSLFGYTFTTAGNYSLTVSGATVCGEQTTNITINPVPAKPLIDNIRKPTDSFICPLGTYTYAIKIPDPTMDYKWTIVGGSIIGSSEDSEVMVQFDPAGTGTPPPYQLSVRQNVKNQLECVSVELEINPIVFTIKAAITDKTDGLLLNPDMKSCFNNIVDYYAVIETGGAIYNDGETYTWSINPPSLGSIVEGQDSKHVKVQWNNNTTVDPSVDNLSVKINTCTVTKDINRKVAMLSQTTVAVALTNMACSGNPSTFTVTINPPLPSGTPIAINFGDDPYGLSQTFLSSAGSSTEIQHTYDVQNIQNTGFNVTAAVTIPAQNSDNICSGTFHGSTSINIQPGPDVKTSLASPNNSFCSEGAINATLVASSILNPTFTWYKDGVNGAVGSGVTLQVTGNAPTGSGDYYCIANLNGCTTISSPFITIAVFNCGTQNGCVLNPAPTITLEQSVCTNPDPDVCLYCGYLDVDATTSPGPQSAVWDILGPNSELVPVGSNSNSTHLTTPITAAGVYHVTYRGLYPCDGALVIQSSTEIFTVPYVPNFSYNVACGTGAALNNYTVSVNDTSSFLSTISNASKHFFFWFKDVTNNTNSPWIAINTVSQPSVDFVGLAGHSYYVRMQIDGTLPDSTIASNTCQKISELITIDSPPEGQYIIVENLNCHDSAVKFSVAYGVFGESYLWNFANQAESTLYPSSHVFEPSTTTPPTAFAVSVTITNSIGCTRQLNIPDLAVPLRCYYGDLGTDTPIICKNGAMELHYATNNEECTVVQYQWLKNNVPLTGGFTVNPTSPGFPSGTSITIPSVSGTPYYKLRLISNANPLISCNYKCETTITPQMKPLPKVRLSSPNLVCQSINTDASVATDAPFNWFVDNTVQPSYANALTFPITSNSYSLGQHILSVTANGENGCSKTTSQNFTVSAMPDPPGASFTIEDCISYKVNLVATPPEGGTGIITWSSGTSNGNTATVYDGGPYMATYNDGSGCLATAQLDVPYRLDKYFWVFPSGCYTECDTNLGYLLGPNAPIPEWQWLLNGDVKSNGTGFVNSFQPDQTGTYNLSLTNACTQTTAPMNLTVNRCEECKFEAVFIKDISCNEGGLIAYTMEVTIVNASDQTINSTITVPGDEVIVAPATVSVPPGEHTYTFTVIANNGFSGGGVTFIINGTNPQDNVCTYKFGADFKDCRKNKATSAAAAVGVAKTAEGFTTQMMLYPNPAQNNVNVQFECQTDTASIAIYDLTGKQLSTQAVNSKKGTVNIYLSTFAAGIYVVVLKENGYISLQKKLIIN